MPLGATIFLFNDQLTFRFSEALNLTLELIETINDICLHRAKLFFKLFDHCIHAILLWTACGQQNWLSLWCTTTSLSSSLSHASLCIRINLGLISFNCVDLTRWCFRASLDFRLGLDSGSSSLSLPWSRLDLTHRWVHSSAPYLTVLSNNTTSINQLTS